MLLQAGPSDGQIMGGKGDITHSGDTTTIQQLSQNLSINCQSFNIAPMEKLAFVPPSSSATAVNRIFDVNGSQIPAHLDAKGQVYLIDPNGIVFGKGAQIDVGGLDDESGLGRPKQRAGINPCPPRCFASCCTAVRITRMQQQLAIDLTWL